MKATYIPLFVTAAAVILASCDKNNHGMMKPGPAGDDKEILVDAGNLLFPELSAYDLNGTLPTKSYEEDKARLVTLESLLQRDKTVTITDDDGEWKMTPMTDEARQTIFLSQEQLTEEINYDWLETSSIKKFLIESPKDIFVVTMVPYYIVSDDDWDYFNMEGFFGNILYSSVDGRLRTIENYHPTKGVTIADIIPASEMEPGKKDYEFINIVGIPDVPETKLSPDEEAWWKKYCHDNDIPVNDGIQEPSFCIARRAVNWDPDNGNYCRGNYGNGGVGDPTGGVSDGGSALGGRPKTTQYEITIDIQGNGSVRGTGKYPKNSIASLTAVPASDSDFYYWTGDICGNDAMKSFTVTKDIHATAVFGPSGIGKPCWDEKNGVFFPISGKGKIAPTNIGGRPESGTYGDVRYEQDEYGNIQTKAHRGWDIEAEPGTPFFAPVKGYISDFIISDVPNKKNDATGCGNRIGITFYKNGEDYSVFFLHLAYTDPNDPSAEGNGIGVNPRTGKTWQKGDVIYAGERLGCTGDTGKAYNVPCPHLHIQINNNPDSRKFGKGASWSDFTEPSLLFGDILTKTGNKVTGYGIKNPCDDLPGDGLQYTDDPYMYSDSYAYLYPGIKR